MKTPRQQILFLRESLKRTQHEFANEIGYSRSYVNDIEAGRVKPSRGFLEAISEKYGISIDSLLSHLGNRVVNAISRISSFSDYGFVFIYDFTDTGRENATRELLEYLSGRSHKFINGRDIRSVNHLFSMLTDAQGSIEKLWKIYSEAWPGEFEFIVIKDFSRSMIKGNKAGVLRDIARVIIPPRGVLILIDTPSFLEKNAKSLYYRAFPIHFADWTGRMNPPG